MEDAESKNLQRKTPRSLRSPRLKKLFSMKQESSPIAQRDIWERTGWLWTAVFYINLFLVVSLGLTDPANAAAQSRILLFGLGLGLWQATLFYGMVHWRLRERPFITTPIVALGVLLWFLLVRIDPVFYFILAGLFPFIYIFLPIGPALLMTLFINSLAAYDNFVSSGRPSDWWSAGLLYWFGYTAVAMLLGVWIYAIIRQSAQRRLLIEQLQRTQTELAAAERREGMLQERDRLAREIHDTLAQGFTSIVLHLEAAEQASDVDPERARYHLNTARETARASLTQARQVVQDLRPDLLAQQSLPAAIERLVARWQEETGVKATAVVTGDSLTLHPDLDITLLRAAQEALANVRKHAQAHQVQVTLSYMGDVVTLDVADDGVGLAGSAPTALSGGFGLTAMRERVAQLGGTVEVESERGAGTTVAVAIPVNNHG